jgi:hypothetical protein
MTNRRRKQLLKRTYINFVVKPCTDIWGASQHEHLGAFNSLTLCRHTPWRLRGTHPVVDLESALCALQKSDYIQKGNLLHKFLLLTREVDSMPASVVRGMFPTAERIQVPGPFAHG